MTVAQARVLLHFVETHGDCPVSASAEGGVVLLFLRGAVVTIYKDGSYEDQKVGPRGKS